MDYEVSLIKSKVLKKRTIIKIQIKVRLIYHHMKRSLLDDNRVNFIELMEHQSILLGIKPIIPIDYLRV